MAVIATMAHLQLKITIPENAVFYDVPPAPKGDYTGPSFRTHVPEPEPAEPEPAEPEPEPEIAHVHAHVTVPAPGPN